MTDIQKGQVEKSEVFDLLELRVGTITAIELEPSARKTSYRLTIDFGKFGKKTSVGRFTQHSIEELIGKQVVGVLNFPPVQMGDTLSEVLILGAQFPKTDSGEATILTPLIPVKIGGKIF
ncbi:tRNA-binding protein YgjH [compost metagenome]